MDSNDVQSDLKHVLYSKEQIQSRITELAAQIDKDYEGRDLLIVGVLKGAVMVMADLARALHSHVSMDWMAVSSYGSGTQSSGVVRILKDLDTDLMGKDVLIVEDIIDSGLTLSWLKTNLVSRGTASVEICTAFRKPDGREGPDRRQVRRLRHPQRVRCGLRPGLRREVPQPGLRRHPGAARLRIAAPATRDRSGRTGPAQVRAGPVLRPLRPQGTFGPFRA